MIDFSAFKHFLDLWNTPKSAFSSSEIKERSDIIVTDNVCPRCSSDSGFRTNTGLVIWNWKCKDCSAVWMTINDRKNDKSVTKE